MVSTLEYIQFCAVINKSWGNMVQGTLLSRHSLFTHDSFSGFTWFQNNTIWDHLLVYVVLVYIVRFVM